MLTEAQIRALYVAQIGEADTSKLEAAGLLPIQQEESWPLVADTTTDSSRTCRWDKNTRLATAWTASP